ncbi:manganese efflux pump MntP family protein [Staphylospora marina]|uniref:manganese efflux pump MntP n=1 Tax=Staphylospora marina TaxID=2490858 RepID=UPI000F5BF054|nr:manganese efflux pump [Staphylospora marina]
MDWSMPQWGQLITMSLIAVALGMDAFSLGIGLGMKRLSPWMMTRLSLSIGAFHVLMPLAGILLGQWLSSVMREIAAALGGAMLCLLGVGMLLQVFRGEPEEKERSVSVSSWAGVLLFSVSVSLDSLSAGLSLGLFSADLAMAILLFGCAGSIMAGTGLAVGRFVGSWAGTYGEALGGLILVILGSKFLW